MPETATASALGWLPVPAALAGAPAAERLVFVRIHVRTDPATRGTEAVPTRIGYESPTEPAPIVAVASAVVMKPISWRSMSRRISRPCFAS